MSKQLLSAVAGGRSLAAGGSGPSRPQPLIVAVGQVLLPLLHVIMQTRQVCSLRARVSAQSRGRS
jgi:hypothetical protein